MSNPKPPPYGVNPPPNPGSYGPPPPQYGFAAGSSGVPPPPPGPAYVTVVRSPLGPESSTIQCPTCHMVVQTTIKPEASSGTHVIALLLCIFGLWPCVCIPYCAECGYTVNHYCPSCNTFLGTYRN